MPGDDGVEVARVCVLGPLVLAAELLAGHAAVLQVLRVAAAGVAPGLRPPRVPRQRAAQRHDVVVSRLAREAAIFYCVKNIFILVIINQDLTNLVSARHSSSQSLLLGTCSTTLSSNPSSFLLGTRSKAQVLSLHPSTAPRRQIFSK